MKSLGEIQGSSGFIPFKKENVIKRKANHFFIFVRIYFIKNYQQHDH